MDGSGDESDYQHTFVDALANFVILSSGIADARVLKPGYRGIKGSRSIHDCVKESDEVEILLYRFV